MKLRVPAFYRDFACIAGACPDSCCQGWEVDADPASMAYYHTLPESEIRRRIFSVFARTMAARNPGPELFQRSFNAGFRFFFSVTGTCGTQYLFKKWSVLRTSR